jgi:nucleoside-diphosphate-sugar epimerase
VTPVLVTGASGFVGRTAVEALVARGHEVHAVARTPAADVPAHRWHTADLLDAGAADRLVRTARPGALLHLAWTTEHGRFWDDPANHAWGRATRELFEAFAAAGGRRAVLAGSCAQYAWDATALGPSGVAHEASTPREPATLYGRLKQETIAHVHTRGRELDLAVAAGLLFFPSGPRDKPGRLVPSVARSLLAGEDALVGAGTQVRDFVHVADCGAAFAALVESPATGDVNAGSGHGASVADVALLVGRIVGRPEAVRIGALAGADDGTRVIADVRRLRDEVGFVPAYDLERGLRDAVDWWRGIS